MLCNSMVYDSSARELGDQTTLETMRTCRRSSLKSESNQTSLLPRLGKGDVPVFKFRFLLTSRQQASVTPKSVFATHSMTRRHHHLCVSLSASFTEHAYSSAQATMYNNEAVSLLLGQTCSDLFKTQCMCGCCRVLFAWDNLTPKTLAVITME